MPIGKRHAEEGLLSRDAGFLILQRDDGGQWRLEVDAPAERLLGRRVRIEGVRSGFDLLEVTGILKC
jgi:hypothetical protein